MSATLGVNRKRFTVAKLLRKSVDDLIEIAKKKESVTLLDDEIKSTTSYDSSEVDVYYADYDDDDKSSDESSESTVGEESENENRNATNTENDKSVDNNESVESNNSVQKESVKKNIFYSVLSPKEKKTRLDKLDLSIVRDFCHEKCRLDTFASSQVFVHNYDGTHSYHQIHVKSQSLMQYYLLFKDSTQYYQWQNENRRKNTRQKNQTELFKYPTINILSMLSYTKAKRLRKPH